MMRHPETKLSDDGSEDALTFDDVTVLVLILAAGVLVVAVFWLGAFCATHRIEAALLSL